MTTTHALASLPAHPSLPENLYFALTGFFFVLAMLALLAGITALIGQRFKQASPARVSTLPAQPVETISVAEDEEDPLLPYLIAATVDTILQGTPHRIVSIKASSENWSREGRRDILSSHKLR